MSKEKRGYIAGNRIVGDIGGISSKVDPVTQAMNKFIMPATNLTGTAQAYYETSATQNYALGSRMAVDERVYRYARAGAALVAPCTYRLQVNADVNSPTTWGLALATNIVAGDTTVVMASAVYQAGTIALNELVGGWIELWGAANAYAWRRIVSNTAAAAGVPATITIGVDAPIDIAIAAGAGVIALHHNFYYNIQMGGSVPAIVNYESAAGLTPVPVAIGRYFWLQTWGPCQVAAQLGTPGAVVNFRDVYYGAAGTLLSFNAAYAAGANVSPQRVGHVNGASTAGDGNTDIILQLAA